MPRHFGFRGLHQHHFIYSCYGESSLENHKSFIIYRICIGKKIRLKSILSVHSYEKIHHIICPMLYGLNGPYYMECRITSDSWTSYLASYWTSGWIYGVVTASDYACAYYEYFSNWVDTMLLIYFLYQLGLILFEYRAMQNIVNNDLDEIVKHPSWKTLRGKDKNEIHRCLNHRVTYF